MSTFQDIIRRSFRHSKSALLSAWNRLRSATRRIGVWAEAHPYLAVILFSFLTNLMLEILGRRSLDQAFHHLIFHFPVFFYNWMLVMATCSISLLVPKRRFTGTTILLLWLVLGLVNWIMLGERITPFSFVDITLLPSVFPIIGKYLNLFEIIAAALFLLGLVFLFVWRLVKAKKVKIDFLKSAVFVGISVGGTFLLTTLFLHVGILTKTFANIADAFRDYGFAYCFSSSMIDRGIDEPSSYSDDMIIGIESSLPKHPDAGGAEAIKDSLSEGAPNLIFVQLESFFDVYRLKNITFSEDPLPNFHYLQENYSSGHLQVPSIGAGTANTEFEILSGMNLEYFGAGEYPYKTVLQTETCESVAYNLKTYGYETHAIHNNSGSFYDRNRVFANLGFDTFTSIEYMNGIRLNPMGWARDAILTDEILKSLNSTKGSDFVFTITVQSHGKYKPGVTDQGQHIKVDGIDDADTLSAFEYYIAELHEVDQFIGNLTNALSERDEKCILVLYGDHLPSFEISDEDLSDGNRLNTDYVIWSNDGDKAFSNDNDRNLFSYQLSSYTLSKAGYDAGILTKFHQAYQDKADYQEKLEILEYDMLYGDKAVYGQQSMLEATDLKMGSTPIQLTGLEYINNQLYVYGNGFTPYSKIRFNDKDQDTVYVNENILIALSDEPSGVTQVTVAQEGNDHGTLSVTDPKPYLPGLMLYHEHSD